MEVVSICKPYLICLVGLVVEYPRLTFYIVYPWVCTLHVESVQLQPQSKQEEAPAG